MENSTDPSPKTLLEKINGYRISIGMHPVYSVEEHTKEANPRTLADTVAEFNNDIDEFLADIQRIFKSNKHRGRNK